MRRILVALAPAAYLPPPANPAPAATTEQSPSRTFVVNIHRFRSEDAIDGEACPATFEVVADSRTLHGCGRSV